jgi:hypothetical protein
MYVPLTFSAFVLYELEPIQKKGVSEVFAGRQCKVSTKYYEVLFLKMLLAWVSA